MLSFMTCISEIKDGNSVSVTVLLNNNNSSKMHLVLFILLEIQIIEIIII